MSQLPGPIRCEDQMRLLSLYVVLALTGAIITRLENPRNSRRFPKWFICTFTLHDGFLAPYSALPVWDIIPDLTHLAPRSASSLAYSVQI